jgi:hypothetical protein
LKAVCELLDEQPQFPRLRDLLLKEEEKPVKSDHPKPRTALRDLLRQRPIASAAVGLGLVGGAVAAAVLLFGGTSPPGSTPSPGGWTEKPRETQVVVCDRYEVAAHDVWLRDQYGTPHVELPHGQRVTVTNRTSTYWAVTVEGGQNGWVDHTYLKPLC